MVSRCLRCFLRLVQLIRKVALAILAHPTQLLVPSSCTAQTPLALPTPSMHWALGTAHFLQEAQGRGVPTAPRSLPASCAPVAPSPCTEWFTSPGGLGRTLRGRLWLAAPHRAQGLTYPCVCRTLSQTAGASPPTLCPLPALRPWLLQTPLGRSCVPFPQAWSSLPRSGAGRGATVHVREALPLQPGSGHPTWNCAGCCPEPTSVLPTEALGTWGCVLVERPQLSPWGTGGVSPPPLNPEEPHAFRHTACPG